MKVKISDIGDIITGKTPSTKNQENYGNDYMFIGPADLHTNFMIEDSEKHISTAGFNSIKNNTINGLSILVGCIGWDMGNVSMVNGKCATNQQINSITNIKSNYNPYYIYYWLKGKKDYLFKIANVTRTPLLNKNDFSKIEIAIPDKKIQDKVANTLLSIDKKISNNVKIINESEKIMELIYNFYFNNNHIDDNYSHLKIMNILDVITGKKDANFSSVDGIYPFFTCSSETLKCDEYEYDGKAILIAGNGDLNVKYYEGKFNAYQRTYILIPKNELYVGLLYKVCEKKIKSLKAGSNGSIIKFITKGDIENIDLYIPDNNDNILKLLNVLLNKIQNCKSQNELLINQRTKLIPLFMNNIVV